MWLFVRLVTEMSHRVLEQRIDIQFCVKLNSNTSDTCAMLSEASGGNFMKRSSVFEWHKLFKASWRVEITNKDNAHHFLAYQGYCSL
jgi:hypothetical protein